MTQHSKNEGDSLQEMGPVTGEFCANSFSDQGALGLVDEATKKAQSSGADVITNASVWTNGGGCVTVEDQGHKIVKAAAAATKPAKK